MLHRHWPEPRPEWHVAALRVTEGAEAAWPEVTFHGFEPSATSLARMLNEEGCETVALHYVPHGYHPKGIPSWLPKGLRLWKDSSGGKLITFFHELFAYGPPWKSSFWLAPCAVSILRQIVRTSDVVLTSNEAYKILLRQFGGCQHIISVLPVGSNVPTFGQAPDLRSGPWRIAVFGGSSTRRAAMQMHRAFLNDLSVERMLGTLVLIGANGGPEEIAMAQSFGSVETHFDATREEASRAIASCDFGVTSSIPHILAKSGVYAAYCAHGLPSIVAGKPSSTCPYVGTESRQLRDVLDEMRDAAAQSVLRHRIASYAEDTDWRNIAQRWNEQIEACAVTLDR